jgi:hypothetical protein
MIKLKKESIKLNEFNQLGKGIEIEHEHKNTYKMIQRYLDTKGVLPPEQLFYKSIAEDHIKEDDEYYTKLVSLGL